MSRGDEARNRTVYFHLFTYGTLKRGGDGSALLEGCDLVATTSVPGTLYNIEDAFPAAVLAGNGRIEGEVWRCPADRLPAIDAYEGITEGLFRRVGLRVDEWACWTYVAGPRLARRLKPSCRVESGRW